MNKFIDFIERHKYGIFATLLIHVAMFLYFQIATYKEPTFYQPWDFITENDEAPDDIEISPDQIETPEEFNLYDKFESLSSNVKDENDSREKSSERDKLFSSSYSKGDARQIEDDYERSIREEFDRKREEKFANYSAESTDVEEELNNKKEETKQTNKNTEKAVSGETMVSFSLSKRHPLNHNDWHIRNPGYTCGEVNGTVKVKIIVDEGGDVISATIIEEASRNATTCMREQAQKYALMSRFNYDANAPKRQEGTITYRFIYR
ncbi:MAG: hypothetical protein WC994_03900 [Brumimicrobium sp.]